MDELGRLLRDQCGVISRRQVLANGGRPGDIERALRRREWVRVLPGVFLDHTGPRSWLQRAWAGVLFYEPAALAGRSALRAAAGPGWRRHPDHLDIEIAVEVGRTVRPVAGYRPVRRVRLAEDVQWNAAPPRVRLEQASLDVAAGSCSDLEAIGVLADVVQLRRTTAPRLLAALQARPRIARRRWLDGVLEDVAGGTCSVLEHGYLTLVERPHGLPRGVRQDSPLQPCRIYRDVTYPDHDQVVELDGRLGHDAFGDRDADLDRDLDAAVLRLGTVRLGWGQVYGRPCHTAQRIGQVLRLRGWRGSVRRCGPECVAA